MDRTGQDRQDAAPAGDVPIVVAGRKTKAVRKKLQIAGAELHLSNAALERHLPKEARRGDVAHALSQRGTIEDKVQQAADELAVVKELLDEEIVARAKLEKKLAQTQGPAS